MTLSMNPQDGPALSRGKLLRDLTLTAEAPMAFCIRLLLQQLMWIGRPEHLFELLGDDPRQLDLVDARNLMLRLGFGSSEETLYSWRQLESQVLPALYVEPLFRLVTILHSSVRETE